MFMLTRRKDDIESGTYATKSEDGSTLVQFFVDRDDAVCYNDQLTAVGYNLQITETPDEAVDKLCEALGYAYTIVEPGQIVIPKMETIFNELSDYL